MVTARRIIERVAEIYGVTAEDLASPRRYRAYSDARAVVCYLLCTLHNCTFSEVGRMLNKRHATIMYHNHKANDWVRRPVLNPRAVVVIREMEKEYNN